MSRAFTTSALRELAFLRRNPWDLALVTWIPLLLMAIVAWQLSGGVMRDLPVAVVDADHSSLGRDLTRRLDAAPGVAVVAAPTTLDEAFSLARQGRVYAVVSLPSGAERDLLRGGQATVIAYYNASYSTPGGAALREIGNAVTSLGGELALTEIAKARGPKAVRAPPVQVQTTILFNPQNSYEWMLVSLIHPALLHLILCVCVISALGRELRDGTAGQWLAACDNRLVPALAGKLLPYLLTFTVYGVLSLVWIAKVRGWEIAGDPWLLILGHVLMYLAYAAIGLLFIGLSKRMAQGLSFAGLYAGASFAFAGAVFPTDGGGLSFASVWSALLPYTAYAKLQIQQMYMAAPLAVSLQPLGALLLFIAIPTLIGFPMYARAVRDPSVWGRR